MSSMWFLFFFFSPFFFFFFFFFFKYKHQCTNNPIGKNGPKENGSWPEITKLINNDMWLVQSANTKQTFTLSRFFFLLNNQEMWVCERFLSDQSSVSWWRLPPSLNQDYMYIFDKTITKYTEEILSAWWFFRLWWHWPDHYPYLRQNYHHPRQPCYHHQLCRHYSNYYTIFYIQQIINKLKVKSAVCAMKQQIWWRQSFIYSFNSAQLREKNRYTI